MTQEFPGWGLRRLDEEFHDGTHFLYYRRGMWIEAQWRPDLRVDLSGLYQWFTALFLNNEKGRHRKR